MAGNIEAVLFDLDDTLGDWATAVDAAIAVAFDGLPADGERERVREALREMTHEWREGRIVNRNHWCLFGEDPPWPTSLKGRDVFPRLEAAFRAAVMPRKYADTAVLAELRSTYRIGLLTNNPYGKTALSEYELLEHFDAVVMMDDPYRKPHRRAFEEGCEAMGCDPARIAFVGDSLANAIEGAVAAGLVPIWIDRFNDNYPLRAGIHRIETLSELPSLLSSLG